MINRKSKYIIILLLPMLMGACKKETSSVPTDEEILGNIAKPAITGEYIYPIQPGTPEWANLSSHAEMIDTTQIPDLVLDTISTWGLLESCLKYPLYGDFSAFNNQISYINDLEQSNKGFKELLSREDAPLVMLYFYRHWDISLYPDFLKRNFIELVLGSDNFISKLNGRQQLYLISLSLDKKLKQEATYSGSTPPYSFFVMANSMIHYGYKPFVEYCSTEKPTLPDGYFFWRINSSCEKIEEYSRSLLNL
jgi:hypothetical protein